jgi:hypothetical protein
MKAAHALALAFLFALLVEPLGLALLTRMTSLPWALPSNSKAPELSRGLLAIQDASGNQVKLESAALAQSGVQRQTRTSLQARAWTVLVYLDGDNDLEAAAFDDLNSMEIVGSMADMAIVVYVDFMTATAQHGAGAECYYVTKDANRNAINSTVLPASLPSEPNMGDPNTLLQFITFGQSYLPAEHYLLVLWDHGGGFYGVCLDETSSEDRLLPGELSSVLSNVAVQPIDVVAFDACLMGQLEIAYELRQDTQIVVFSEESIPESGFPYEKFLDDLGKNRYWLADDLANSIVSRYNEAYAPGGIYYNSVLPDTDICLSAVKGNNTAQVAGALNNLVQPLLIPATLRECYETICKARGATQSFDWADFMDLGDFALQLHTALGSGTLANLSLILYDAVLSAVSHEQHLSGLPGATGLGLAFSTHYGIPLALLADTSYEQFMWAFEGVGNTSANWLPISGAGIHYGYLDGKGDDVYFRFSTSSSAVLTFGLDPMQVYDEDFDLYLYDSGLNLLRASEGYTSTEFIEYNCVAAEVYYIRVHSYNDPDIENGLGAFTLTILPASWIDPTMLAILVIAITVIALVTVCAVAASRQSRMRRWERSSAYTQHSATATYSPAPPRTGNPGFCTNCGAPLPAGVQRCPSCGHERD